MIKIIKNVQVLHDVYPFKKNSCFAKIVSDKNLCH